MIKYPQPLRN